jgi:hypothetical protein
MPMPSVEVAEVMLIPPDTTKIRGHNIEAPKPGARVNSEAMFVAGWVLGTNAPVQHVEFTQYSKKLRETPLEISRPDIIAAFPDVGHSEHSGFRTTVAVPGSEAFELHVLAVLLDGDHASIGTIRVGAEPSATEEPAEETMTESSGPLSRLLRRVFGK